MNGGIDAEFFAQPLPLGKRKPDGFCQPCPRSADCQSAESRISNPLAVKAG
jgi:hypothetical protein